MPEMKSSALSRLLGVALAGRDRAREVAVALEQEDAELRRLLRHIHRRSPEPFYRGPEEGPEDLCDAGCGFWPCATRFLIEQARDAAG
jgi:hypothetical protein